MRVYKVGFGLRAGLVDESWIVRGRNFAEAVNKAVRIAARAAKEYTSPGRDVISVELLGNEVTK